LKTFMLSLFLFSYAVWAHPYHFTCQYVMEHSLQQPGQEIMGETSALTLDSDGGLEAVFGNSLPSCIEAGLTYTITASGMSGRVVSIFGDVTMDESLPECSTTIGTLPCKRTVDCDLFETGQSHAKESSSDSSVTFTTNSGDVEIMAMVASGYAVTYSRRFQISICSPTPESTFALTADPTFVPIVTIEPTFAPSVTLKPTFAPTPQPTFAPSTADPTFPPSTTLELTNAPKTTPDPTFVPTRGPTFAPSTASELTVAPTPAPTFVPTFVPTPAFTFAPSTTLVPTFGPTITTIIPEPSTTPEPTSEPTFASSVTPAPTFTGTWSVIISLVWSGPISSTDEDVITSTIASALGVDSFYLDVSNSTEYTVFAVNETEKDLLLSMVVDFDIQSNLSSVLQLDDLTVSTTSSSIPYEDTDCMKLWSTDVSIDSFGTLKMFISSERVHIRVQGPDRWFAIGIGSQMSGSDAFIFDGLDSVLDTKLGSYYQGYIIDDTDDLEHIKVTTESDGGFTIDFWRNRDTGDVEGDSVVACGDTLQMIWAKGGNSGEQISSAGHSSNNRGAVIVQFSEVDSILSVVAESTTTSISGKREKQLLHAWIMIIAWLILIPTGVLSITLRRILYAEGRPLASWADEGCLTKTFWFNMHRFCNTTALLLTFVGVCVAYTLAGDAHYTHSHGRIGLVILFVSIIQVMGGVLRPDKTQSIRKGWAVIHRVSGVALFVMALVNMYIAEQLPKLVSYPLALREIAPVWGAIVLLVPLGEFFFRTSKQRDAGLVEIEQTQLVA